MAEIIGSSLGKYDILEELGRGGFGAVYRVRNRDLDREEALKVLGQHRQWDPTFVRRFQREARIAARLRHPHIVTIYEVGEAEGAHYLSMAYLPGRTLAQLVASEGALPQARVARLIAQVAEALDYAHAQGLIHRDIKPSNIMVGPADDVTLMDFGLVKAADHSELSQELYSSGAGFTTAAAAMGTPEYMAPELAEPNGPSEDYRADIYSLGVVAYQVLTGHLPFAAPTPVAVLRAHIDLAPPPLTQWVASLPAPVNAAVLRALAKNPAERYPSAGGFAAALTEAARQAEAEQTRTERVAALYAQAQEALGAKNWAAALAACGQVIALDANYRDAGALFDQANQGLAKQRAWEAQQEEMAQQYERGTAHLAEGKWDEAIVLLQPLAAGDQVFRDADRKLAEALASQEAETTRRREQIDRLSENALAALQTARRYLTEIHIIQPDWQDKKGELGVLLPTVPSVDSARAAGRDDGIVEGKPAIPGLTQDQRALLDPDDWLLFPREICAFMAPYIALAVGVFLADWIFRLLPGSAKMRLILAFGIVFGLVGFVQAMLLAPNALRRPVPRHYSASFAILWTVAGVLAGWISYGWWMSRWVPPAGTFLTYFYTWRNDFPILFLTVVLVVAALIQTWLLANYMRSHWSRAACLTRSSLSVALYLGFPFFELWVASRTDIEQVLSSIILLQLLFGIILLAMVLALSNPALGSRCRDSRPPDTGASVGEGAIQVRLPTLNPKPSTRTKHRK